MSAALNLLLIDDSRAERDAVAHLLRAAGQDVKTSAVASLADILAPPHGGRYDAILLGMPLPATLTLLRQLDELGAGIAVLVLAGDEQAGMAEACVAAGAQDVLLKGELDGARLLRSLNLACKRQEREQVLRVHHDRLQRLAERDLLTGLANRAHFESALQKAVLQAQRQRRRVAVLLLNLDGFKRLNECHGHEGGDRLLQMVARRLGDSVRGSDLLARLEADEFAVLARDMERDDQSRQLAERLLESLRAPLQLADTEHVVTPRIGVAVLGQCADNAPDLLKCADIAMERARHGSGEQVHFYSDTLHHAVHWRATLEHDLRDALRLGQFRLYYQAQVTADGARLAGVETLLRWQHPGRGLLLPKEFLPIAEELGLMGEVSAWVLRSACQQLARWRDLAPLDSIRISVAVNLSALQLQNESLLGTVEQALADSGLDSRFLELEITENVFIDQPERAAAILQRLKAGGVTLSLDDFGTGYSSLRHLQLFPVSVLKIDRAFVSCIGQGEQHDRLMAAIIHFARTLGLAIVAEGVETREQAEFCRQHGCDLLQGFYFSQPLPADQFERRYLLSQAPLRANG